MVIDHDCHRELEKTQQSSGTAGHCMRCGARVLSVCGAMEPADLQRLAEISTTHIFQPHDTITIEAEPVTALYNITVGTVKLFKLLSDGRRQITGFLSVGDFLGLALTDLHAYSAEAVTLVTACRFERPKLESLLQTYPSMERRLLENAFHELAAAQDQMMMLGRKTARERVASFLIIQSDRGLREKISPTLLRLPMSRTDIADYLGLTTETVSRTITAMRKEGLIELVDMDKIRLLDLSSLKKIASA